MIKQQEVPVQTIVKATFAVLWNIFTDCTKPAAFKAPDESTRQPATRATKVKGD